MNDRELRMMVPRLRKLKNVVPLLEELGLAHTQILATTLKGMSENPTSKEVENVCVLVKNAELELEQLREGKQIIIETALQQLTPIANLHPKAKEALERLRKLPTEDSEEIRNICALLEQARDDLPSFDIEKFLADLENWELNELKKLDEDYRNKFFKAMGRYPEDPLPIPKDWCYVI